MLVIMRSSINRIKDVGESFCPQLNFLRVGGNSVVKFGRLCV